MPTSRSARPVIFITAGDRRGIGPEVIAKALRRRALKTSAQIVVLDDPDPDPARAAIKNIDRALELLAKNRGAGLVTGPVSKETIAGLGISFPGHTEYLAKKTNSRDVVMMLANGPLRISLVTRHIPLEAISSNLSRDSIYKTIVMTHTFLKTFCGIASPRIGVAALNPHAGEGGRVGREELEIIIPAVKKARHNLPHIEGPLPADTLFRKAAGGAFDACVAMYHDQALIALKMLKLNRGVNITIGLPFVRTSPLHGTAKDIVGRGEADAASMIEAIKTAIALTARHSEK